MDIQRFEIENITKSGFACVRDILTDRLLVTSDSCDLLNEQYQKILDLQHQLDQQKAMWNELKEWLKNQITDLRHIEIKTKTQSLRVNDAVNCFREVLYKMQELEQGGENEN